MADFPSGPDNNNDPNKPSGSFFANNGAVGGAGQPCTVEELKAAVLRRAQSGENH